MTFLLHTDLIPKNLRWVDRIEKKITIEWDATEEPNRTYTVTCKPMPEAGGACTCEKKETEYRYTCKISDSDSGKLINITVLPAEPSPPLPCSECSISVLSGKV